MALNVKQSTALQGYSQVGGQQVIYLSANITEESVGNTSVNQSIQDQALYAANRTECRKDIAAFQDKVYEIEDAYLAEQEAEVTE